MKKLIIFNLLILLSMNIKAQNKKSNFWNTLKGKELETSITFLPAGTHYTSLEFNEVWYTGFNYKSYETSGVRNFWTE